MILVPLPFVVSLLLLTILVQAVRRDEEGLRANPLFVALIAAYSVQSVLVGLRWGYEWRGVLPLMSPLAALIAPLAWASFRSLTREEPAAMTTLWPHLLPAAAVVALMVLWPDPVGAVIVAVFAGYGLALLWTARLGPNGLVSSRLDGVLRSHRAMQITGVALLASAATDILIGLDFAWGGGAHSGMLVALGNVVALLVQGKAASIAGAGLAEIEADDPNERPDAPTGATNEDLTTAALVERLMREQEIYRDLDLNLERIARKLRRPARDVSSAINRAHGMSVSQYVNTYRVKRARQLLKETADPITKVMFDAGFGTKSNFNREFQRVTGMTPSAYRRTGDEASAVAELLGEATL
ncbi:helix-turn-helix domain-containing protein [Aureimonas pseudogalii]|uniref:AraC-like DNA-binding protein n=1 Tax=Aureimonas pseudogalii TaxID=1744844 RepID=A0A7W6H8P3_9HYPH|nr:AraC family transcriptional regulator [Aureimonas pseudogalii]MBB4000669.1 AraC-like DNA-binding protein [Aureimonas pseudogalii]